MDTSPPEDLMRPEPFPSVSTPVRPVHSLTLDSRPRRRHTSAHSEEDDPQEAFDRISGILSTLLQEANNAIKEEYNDMLPFKAATLKSRPLSRLSRPAILHDPPSSASTLMSFEPLSPASSVTTLVNDDEDDDTTAVDEENDLLSRTKKEHHPAFLPPLPSPLIHRKQLSLHQQQPSLALLLPAHRLPSPPRRRDPLAESFKRLDSSMALVDSLSRDLALETKEEGDQQQQQQQKQVPQSALRLTALLILPFLHIPHTLVTTIFDSLSTSDPNNFVGVIAWGLFFALANVVVNRLIRPKTTTAMQTTPAVAPTTVPESMRSPPASIVSHHHAAIYRRRRAVRRPSVYRTKLSVPPSPTSALLVRSRTQPGETLHQPQQPTLLLQPFQQQRPVVKRCNSF